MRLQNRKPALTPMDQPVSAIKKERRGARFHEPRKAAGETSSWTKGQALSTKAITVSAWAALFLLWPAIFTFMVGGFQKPAVSAPASKQVQVSPLDQSAGAVAQGFVSSWLSASRTNDAGLSAYSDLSTVSLPEAAFEYKDLAVASLSPKSKAGVIQVQLAAEVKESRLDKDQKETVTWQQRFFQVAILVEGERVAPVGMPRAIASPLANAQKPYGFTQVVPATDPLAQSISSFLEAYVAGVGDITRYISPGAAISAITPAPYTSIKVQEFKTTASPETSPADGTTIEALTRAQLTTATGQQVTADYALVLAARAGRWEVSDLDPTIITKPLIDTTTTTGK